MPQIARQKRESSRLRKYRIHTFIVIVIVAGALAVLWPTYVRNSQLEGDINKLSMEKKRLSDQNLALKEEVRRLNTPEYVEQLARQDLGLVKPGEVPITQTLPANK